jgi:hypothetical protein
VKPNTLHTIALEPKPDFYCFPVAKVEYPLHWLYGHEVTVVRCHGNDQLLVETPNGRLCLPTWMTDRTACALLTCGWQPFVSDQALLQLDALLTAVDRGDLRRKLDS